jgi:hypothetical protein
VELGTPAARPLSFEAVLSQAARNRTTSDVRVAERGLIKYKPSTAPELDYSVWGSGGTKKVVLTGEFWDNPATAFSGSGSLGTASYTKFGNYPAELDQPCFFSVTVTDTRVPDPNAVPPQTAETYSIPVRIEGVGLNKEGIAPIATLVGSGGWDVSTGTATVTLMPGASQTVTASGVCLQSGLGKHVFAMNAGLTEFAFEVEPGPRYVVFRRDEDASPRWGAIPALLRHSVRGRFHDRIPQFGSTSIGIRVRIQGGEQVLDSVGATNLGADAGKQLTAAEQQQRSSSPQAFIAFWNANPGTECLAVREDNTWYMFPTSRPATLRLNGTFAAPWQKGTTKTVNTSDTAFPSVPVSNGLGDVRGVGSRSCVIVGTENQNGGYNWSLVEADLGWSGIIQGTFTAPWPKNESKQITVNFGNGSEEISVSNPYASIAGTAEKSCVVANLGTGGTDNWILIAAECS